MELQAAEVRLRNGAGFAPPGSRLRSLVLIACGVIVIFMAVVQWSRGDGLAWNPADLGHDRDTYMWAAQRWLSGGSFYLPYQLAGPYELLTNREVLYPPTSIPLFALFSVLPAVLWWLPVPIVIGVAVWQRPNPVALMILVIAGTTPWVWVNVLTGNPVIWACAALALGTVYGWPGAAVLLKPSLAPFALFGSNTRGWWALLAVGGAMAVVLAPMWPQWLTVMSNAHGGRVGILYSLGDISMMCIPLIAWAGSTRRRAPLG